MYAWIACIHACSGGFREGYITKLLLVLSCFASMCALPWPVYYQYVYIDVYDEGVGYIRACVCSVYLRVLGWPGCLLCLCAQRAHTQPH